MAVLAADPAGAAERLIGLHSARTACLIDELCNTQQAAGKRGRIRVRDAQGQRFCLDNGLKPFYDPAMIKLTDQIKEVVDKALANGVPCILATASADGEPDIGYKGSMMVFDDESLAYWERTRRQHLKNVLANPKVVVLFRDPKVGINFRFHGVATVHDQGPIRDQVMARTVAAELDKDPERKGSAVVIRLDKVTNLGGQVLQSR